MIWLVISEGWCGDAAQNMPVVEKIVDEMPNVEIRYVLRDENLELMDQYLTNGGRSIPKALFVDTETFEVLGRLGTETAENNRISCRIGQTRNGKISDLGKNSALVFE